MRQINAATPLSDIRKIAILIFVSAFLNISACVDNNANNAEEDLPENSEDELVQKSDIKNISIIKLYPDAVDVEVDFNYDGAAGKYASVTVELITADKISNPMLRKDAGAARIGSGNKKVRIERPRLEVEEFTTERIKVTFTNKTSSEVIMEETVNLPVVWESKLDDPRKELLDYWGGNAGNALQSGYFIWLDRAFSEWNDPEIRTIDGKWRLDAMIRIMDLLAVQGRWNNIYNNIQEWKKHSPGLPGPAIVESLYWYAYAWNARGKSYASKVTETGWELFKERLEKAEKVLLDSKSYASDNPLWYFQYIRVSVGLGWDKVDTLKLFMEAITKEPQFYQTYFTAVRAMSPKWGGSFELMDKIATSSAEFTQGEEGEVLYARVYWSIDGNLLPRDEFFQDTLVDWERMKTGFEQLLAEYPESARNLTSFASFACRAGDKEAYLQSRQKVDLLWTDARVWKTGYSPDTCDHMFMEKL